MVAKNGILKMSYNFFQNKKCEFFPCKKTNNLNCLFCFCPLFNYKNCGGNYKTLKNGIKDCSNCLLPHKKNGYNKIINFLKNTKENDYNRGKKEKEKEIEKNLKKIFGDL